MRWLLVKDVQILRRSPLLVVLLVVYPVAISLMMGFALSSPPAKPRVAFYDQVPPGQGTIALGGQRLDVASYASDLLRSVQPIRASSQGQAVADVRDGRAVAAVVIPADLPQEIDSLVTQGVGRPTVRLYLNSADPLERDFVDGAIASRVSSVQQSVSREVLRVALSDLQTVLGGGTVQILGQRVNLLGLRNARTIVAGSLNVLPARFPLRAALRQVVGFADLAIAGLGFARPVLGSIGSPLTVQETQLAGRTTPTATYAAAIAVIISLQFVAMLLAAGMLALERSENTYPRLMRGSLTPARLLVEKIALAAGCALLVALVLAAGVSLFVGLEWSRIALWIAAFAFGACAFAALGVAAGAVAREVSAASLLAFAIALPVAFVALVPGDAVGGPVRGVLDVVAFVFPFRSALDAASNALSGASSPAIGPSLVHLALLTLVFGGLAIVAMRRFALR
jgi:ABC-type multidrug transport system permease subunit